MELVGADMDTPQRRIPLNDTDCAILNSIDTNGRSTIGVLEEELPDAPSKTYLSTRVKRMYEHGLLARTSTVYDLTDTGRSRLAAECD